MKPGEVVTTIWLVMGIFGVGHPGVKLLESCCQLYTECEPFISRMSVFLKTSSVGTRILLCTCILKERLGAYQTVTCLPMKQLDCLCLFILTTAVMVFIGDHSISNETTGLQTCHKPQGKSLSFSFLMAPVLYEFFSEILSHASPPIQ